MGTQRHEHREDLRIQLRRPRAEALKRVCGRERIGDSLDLCQRQRVSVHGLSMLMDPGIDEPFGELAHGSVADCARGMPLERRFDVGPEGLIALGRPRLRHGFRVGGCRARSNSGGSGLDRLERRDQRPRLPLDILRRDEGIAVLDEEPLDEPLHRVTEGSKPYFEEQRVAQREHVLFVWLFAEVVEATPIPPPFNEANQSTEQRDIRGRLGSQHGPALDFLQRNAGDLGEEIEINAGRVETSKSGNRSFQYREGLTAPRTTGGVLLELSEPAREVRSVIEWHGREALALFIEPGSERRRVGQLEGRCHRPQYLRPSNLGSAESREIDLQQPQRCRVD